MMSQPASRSDAYFLDDFAASAAKLPGADVRWLSDRRDRAIEIFRRSGVPHRRIEDWKFTDLRAALPESFAPAVPLVGSVHSLERMIDPFAALPGPRIVIVNGLFNHALSRLDEIPAGLQIVDLASEDAYEEDWIRETLGLADRGPMAAASMALMRGGVAIRLRANATTAKPLHLRFLNPARGAVAQNCRVVLVVESGTALTILESHVGGPEASGFSNVGFDTRIRDKGRVNHVRIQHEAMRTVHVTSLNAWIEQAGTYNLSQFDLGSKLSRLDLNAELAGEGASFALGGLALLGGTAHADVTTRVRHLVPKGLSRQKLRQVLGGHARGVYQGLVHVLPGAEKTDSHQVARALLLSAGAEADMKPELEIFADDVTCGHGAAIGDIDAEHLFYLRARGIPESEARALLVRGFIEEAVGSVLLREVEDAVWAEIEPALQRILGGMP